MEDAADEPDGSWDGGPLYAQVVGRCSIVPVIVGQHEEVGHDHTPTSEGQEIGSNP